MNVHKLNIEVLKHRRACDLCLKDKCNKKCEHAIKRCEKMDRLDNEVKPPYEYNKEGYMLLVKSAPAADVVEVKHGRWMVPSCEIKIFEDKYVICSECNVMIPVIKELDMYYFCPRCGAKMDG